MLYYLLEYLHQTLDPPGFRVFSFITVRASLAAATALLIATVFGRRIINWLQKNQFGEKVRDDLIISHAHKAGTPTMGGIIIIISIVGATILWGAVLDIYIQIILVATVWMGAFGFADDFIKVIKKDKQGLARRTKIIGQVSLGLLVGILLYFHPQFADVNYFTDLPFVKDYVLNYDFLSTWITTVDLGWLIYVPVVIFIITAVSNAVNLTDGLDGLAAGVSAFVGLGLVGLTYIAGNRILADFLLVTHLPGAGELAVFAAALAAACFGFLWYNGYPAEVFMGDTGSLSLGAAIGTLALLVKKELLLPLLCGVFFLETLSVIMQTSYFKYTKRRTGEGKRIFRVAPLHHHYEAMGMHESKIVIRFWIVTAILVIVALLTLRIR